MVLFWQAVISGITTGCVYGLIALTFNSIYNATKVINFALGEFVMVGAMITYFGLLVLKLPLLVALALVLVVAIIVGLAVDKISVAPLAKRGAEHITIVISTMAASIVIGQVVQLTAGPVGFAVPYIFGREPLRVSGVSINPQNIVIIVVALLAMGGFWFLMHRTLFGMAFRATGFNTEVAGMQGVNTYNIRTFSFIFSAGLCGITGLLIAPLVGAHPLMGFPLLIKGFVATILGGIGNPYGAMLAGIMVGLASSFLVIYGYGFISEIAIFGLLMVFLVIRPTGILGKELE